MYKIIFSDVDGTLLDSSHNLSSLNKEAIKKVISKGIPFVIISGRSPSAIRLINKLGDFKSPMICYGGCLMKDENDNVLFNIGLDKNKSNEILNYLTNKYDDITYCIYADDNWYSPDRSHPRIKLEEEIVRYPAIEGDMSKVKEELINKMLIISNEKDTITIEKDLTNRYPMYSIVKSSNIQIEIMPKGINKGFAVLKFCSIKGIDLKDVVALGDHFNDEPMLDIVGKYYLMNNAPEDLKKKLAPFYKTNNESGVYYALKDAKLI